MTFQDQLSRYLRPLKSRIQLSIARAVVKIVDDAKMMQALQVGVQADVVRSGVERFQQYGFTSYPLAGAEGIAVAIGGNTAHTALVAVDDRRYRPAGLLAEGDVALYWKDTGILVWLKTNGMVELGPSPTDFVALSIPTKAEINALRTTVNSLITAYNTHVHSGVLVGGASTAATLSTASAPAAVGDVKATKVKAI